MAGPTSVQTFRHNFLVRLAEAFYNLERLYDNSDPGFSLLEFKTYRTTYERLITQGLRIPTVLADVYERLCGKIQKTSLPSKF